MADIDITRADTWPEFLTPQQVSEILQITVASVRAMCDSGDLACHTFGPRTVRILKSSLTARNDRETQQTEAITPSS